MPRRRPPEALKRKRPKGPSASPLSRPAATCHRTCSKVNRELFLKADGVQLMILLIKRRKLKKDTRNKTKKHLLSRFNKLMRESAIRVLSYAVQGQPTACNTLIDSNGLGSVCGIFMLRPKGQDETASEIPGFVLSVMHHCFMYLNQVPPPLAPIPGGWAWKAVSRRAPRFGPLWGPIWARHLKVALTYVVGGRSRVISICAIFCFCKC